MLKSRHVSGTTAAFTASTGCAGLPDTDVVPLRLPARSEEHTSELQSQSNLVCRLLLEKKQTIIPVHHRQTHPVRHHSDHLAENPPCQDQEPTDLSDQAGGRIYADAVATGL